MGSAQSCFTDEDVLLDQEEKALLCEAKINLICPLGSGKSSCLNTILDKSESFKVKGAQVQGTTSASKQEYQLREFGKTHSMTLVDNIGYSKDTNLTESTLYDHLMSIRMNYPDRGATRIMFILDLQSRITSKVAYNTLLHLQLFQRSRNDCFLCFSKWNTNSVMYEWNNRLLRWIKSNKRKNGDHFTEPPKVDDMFRDYVQYLNKEFMSNTDIQALQKIAMILEFFQDRVLFFYNLDKIEIDDREDEELEAYKLFLYQHYREIVLERLLLSSNQKEASHDCVLPYDMLKLKTLSHKAVEKMNGTHFYPQISTLQESQTRLKSRLDKIIATNSHVGVPDLG